MSSEIVSTKLCWRPSMNGVTIEADMDVQIHKGTKPEVVLIVPGVDGSADGYNKKYVRMAAAICKDSGVHVVRISNPFITSFNWDDNVRQALNFITNNSSEFISLRPNSIDIIAHSAGASITAEVAHEYPLVRNILLINMAEKLHRSKIIEGLEAFNGKVSLVFGTEDPSIGFGRTLGDKYNLVEINGADHFFSNNHTETFINIPLELDWR